MDDMKRCSICDNEKELSEFNFRKDTQRYRNQCRNCNKLINEEYRTIKKDEIKTRNKEYRNNTKNLKRLYDMEYFVNVVEIKIQHYREKYFQNKKKIYKEIKREKMKILIFD